MDTIKDTALETRIKHNRRLAAELVESAAKECPDELNELLETGALDKWLNDETEDRQ